MPLQSGPRCLIFADILNACSRSASQRLPMPKIPTIPHIFVYFVLFLDGFGDNLSHFDGKIIAFVKNGKEKRDKNQVFAAKNRRNVIIRWEKMDKSSVQTALWQQHIDYHRHAEEGGYDIDGDSGAVSGEGAEPVAEEPDNSAREQGERD